MKLPVTAIALAQLESADPRLIVTGFDANGFPKVKRKPIVIAQGQTFTIDDEARLRHLLSAEAIQIVEAEEETPAP